MIDGQVTRWMCVALIARAPVPLLTTPRPEDARTEPLPGPRAVQGVVTASVGRSCVDSAATTRPAGQNAASRAELHGSRRIRASTDLTLVTLKCTPVDIAMSVIGEGGAGYSPRVLRLWASGYVRSIPPSARTRSRCRSRLPTSRPSFRSC